MMDSQLKKGILEICILSRIAKSPEYGYPIIKQVAGLFPDVLESTVYAILRRLAASNYTEAFYGTESDGPERKYYRVTEEGLRYLRNGLREWKELTLAVESMLAWE
jgi:PadR family transcriptional regulator PadR